MDNFVITIARSYGSGGRRMGKLLAEQLGYEFYDREILRKASDESGINEELFSKADEKSAKLSLFRIARQVYTGEVIPPDSDDFISNENLFRYQAKIIRRLAETENCVIVGRCANFILKDQKHVVNVYVHAPEQYCVRTVMNLYGIDREEAEKRIHTIDKRRSEYYKYFTGKDWRLADAYDLCIDSSRMDWTKCIQIVKAYLECI